MKQVSVTFTLQLPALIREQDGAWTASCPILDVWTQGDSKEEARESLFEALQLWLESCYERGTLEAALKECGFSPADVSTEEHEEFEETITVPLHLLSESDMCTA